MGQKPLLMLSWPTYQVDLAPFDMYIRTPLDSINRGYVGTHLDIQFWIILSEKSHKRRKVETWSWWRMSLEVWFVEDLPYYIFCWKFVTSLLLMIFSLKKGGFDLASRGLKSLVMGLGYLTLICFYKKRFFLDFPHGGVLPCLGAYILCSFVSLWSPCTFLIITWWRRT